MLGAASTPAIPIGLLMFVVLLSAALTGPVAWWLLHLYRRAVRKAMRTRQAIHEPPPLPAEPPPLPELEMPTRAIPDLVIRTSNASQAVLADTASGDYRAALRSLRHLATVYVIAGLAYAVVVAVAWCLLMGYAPTRVLIFILIYAWPIVPALWQVAAVSRGERVLITLGYVAVFALGGGYALLRNPDLTALQLLVMWLLANAPVTLLLLTFQLRRVRAVGPLVLAFMLVATIGAQLAVSAAGSSDASLRAVVDVGSAFGLGGHGIFIGLLLLGFGVFGVLGWLALRWLGRRYQARKFSEQSLQLDVMWCLFATELTLQFALEGLAWLWCGPAAFAAYKLTALLGYRGLRERGEGRRAPTLLLLRVFKLGPRSERLYDALSRYWLRLGPLQLIAGPDLVTATVEPHEFLDFLARRLPRHFVAGEIDLDQRVAQAETGHTPDGRYRVNEYFCYANTWQATMRRLTADSDAALMDLRAFTPANRGCLFELEQLLAGVPLARLVLVVDASTDQAFLEQQLQRLWQQLPAHALNKRGASAELQICRIDAQTASAVRGLLRMLFAARCNASNVAT